MSKNNKIVISLLLTGFVQVYFVALNTFLITRFMYVGVLTALFMVSFVWLYNVKRVVFGSINDRLAYDTGTALGSVSGLFTSQLIVLLLTILLTSTKC